MCGWGVQVFLCLFACWSHNPVATLSLCLLAQAYGLAARLVQEELAHVDITVGKRHRQLVVS